jgi:hypothetical protein
MLRLTAALLATVLCLGSASAATIKVTQGTGTGMIFVEGDIAASDAATFSAAADRFKSATVVLESNGGNLVSGVTMGAEVRRRGFSTLVPNGATCASVCASIWLGGETRSMGPASRVGFHSAYLMVGGKPEANEKANEIHREYFRDIGLAEETINYITMAGPGSMTWMTADAAAAVGIRYATVGARTPAAPSMPVASAVGFGKPTVYHDLNLRAASFNEAKPSAKGCRMLLLADNDDSGESYVDIVVPRKGVAGTPSITVYSKSLQGSGQPRVVSVSGEMFELDRGSNWGRITDADARRAIAEMHAVGKFAVTAMRIDGTTSVHTYRSKGIAAAVDRTARDCGKAA